MLRFCFASGGWGWGWVGGQAVVCSTLLQLQRNEKLESSSAIQTHTFPLQPEKCSVRSLHTGSLESPQNTLLSKGKGLLRKDCPLLCCGHNHTDKRLFLALESDVCLRCMCVDVVKCVYLSMCAGASVVEHRESAPLS